MAGWRDRAVKVGDQAPTGSAETGWRTRAQPVSNEPRILGRQPGDYAPDNTVSVVEEADASVGAEEAVARGISQGSSFGFGDELGGVIGAAAEVGHRIPGLRALMDLGPYARSEQEKATVEEFGELPLGEAMAQAYRKDRDVGRAYNDEARAAHPKTFLAAEIGGSLLVPGGGAAKGATKAARLLKGAGKSSGLAGLYGLGSTSADLTEGEFGTAAKDVGVSAGLGAAASFLPFLAGETGRKILDAAEKGSATARELLRASLESKAAKALASAVGRKGGASNALLHSLEKARDIVARAAEFPDELVQGARRLLASPEAQAAELNAAKNILDGFGGKSGAVRSAEEAVREAIEKGTPEAIEAAEKLALQNPFLSVLWPRVRKQIIDRGLVPAVGGLAGGPAGALGGAVAGAALGGRPSSAFERALADPALRARVAEWLGIPLGKAINAGADTVRRTIPAGVGRER